MLKGRGVASCMDWTNARTMEPSVKREFKAMRQHLKWIVNDIGVRCGEDGGPEHRRLHLYALGNIADNPICHVGHLRF